LPKRVIVAFIVKVPSFMSPSFSSSDKISGADVTAVLGPTNTGKTHMALERMTGYASGMIGLPLRLLAREVYQRLCERLGQDKVALVTGEEKIVPANARYTVATVEAMPQDQDFDFVAIDEVQLAGSLERGHVFTDRLLHCRGRQETLLLGAQTIQPLLVKLLPGLSVVTRPRLSELSYAGSKKLTRLPERSAIVAFSAQEVYAIAELIRRQRGGAAVVLGALSPRTRNAQVELYQSGHVDFLVATDAIGMGLNLDVDHVAFAGMHKFDGFQQRPLTPAEIGQIAGRAGRHMKNGTFGITGQVKELDEAVIEQVQNHDFAALDVIQWRNSSLDFTSLKALQASLDELPAHPGLVRALPQDDAQALASLMDMPAIADMAQNTSSIRLLWDVCQMPDFRRTAPAEHTQLIYELYTYLIQQGSLPDQWVQDHIRRCDYPEGDIDTLSQRIAHIRTWTYIAHRADWLNDPLYWQQTTREVEDRLSDALHEKLTQRFVDRRTSVLMRRLKEKDQLEADIAADGSVLVEGQKVGQLQGLRFIPDNQARTIDGKAMRQAARLALSGALQKRTDRLLAAGSDDLVWSDEGLVRWQGEPVARLVRGPHYLQPDCVLLVDEMVEPDVRDRLQAHLKKLLGNRVEALLKPLLELQQAEHLSGFARGLAYQLIEHYGVVEKRPCCRIFAVWIRTQGPFCARWACALGLTMSLFLFCSNLMRQGCSCSFGRFMKTGRMIRFWRACLIC
jgi:ATP-dependent RNA helicase SUPV3L1/SUV3